MWLRKPEASHCREVGKALAAMHVAGEGFEMTPPQRAVGRRLAAALEQFARPRRRGRAGPATEIATELDFLEPIGRRTCRRASSMPIFSRQCLLPRR
jgi:homoserine kinase type II